MDEVGRQLRLRFWHLALGVVAALVLAAPSLADDSLPPPLCAGVPCVSPPLGRNIPAPVTPLRQADWKLEASYGTWHPDKRNRIFYARTPGQAAAWNYHLYGTYATRKALHQNFSRYGLLAIFLTGSPSFSSIAGIYLRGDHALNVVLRAPLPPPPMPPGCTPPPGDVCIAAPSPTDVTGPTGATAPSTDTAATSVATTPEYRLIAIRKDSLPGRVKRLYITYLG